jgi:hypothetical protein
MSFYTEEIKKLVEKDNFRQVHNIEEKHGKYLSINGGELLNFSSNDYLNLSTDRKLINEFVEKYKNDNEFIFSSTSSRLLTGTSSCYKQLEQNLASLFKKEACLLFNTGYQCNLGVVSSLVNRDDVTKVYSTLGYSTIHNQIENLFINTFGFASTPMRSNISIFTYNAEVIPYGVTTLQELQNATDTNCSVNCYFYIYTSSFPNISSNTFENFFERLPKSVYLNINNTTSKTDLYNMIYNLLNVEIFIANFHKETNAACLHISDNPKLLEMACLQVPQRINL